MTTSPGVSYTVNEFIIQYQRHYKGVYDQISDFMSVYVSLMKVYNQSLYATQTCLILISGEEHHAERLVR